ncbi:hypothetical protein [Paragemmobacter straminiformis]|uniref:Tetratricopeptide repeat-like domain-containing protein n=1 Tax=Paragemmobacter straminiformis TaxID=2045119 RepID=A0A842I8E1_9RHOB|nr:hypothetical protein [Gemmobacter straminiformis]MBC2835899.1 hypothetical protein [Gemmobacter straminiformis]
MSNPDSFIDEVTEEVRRDRLFAMFRKYGWIGVLIVVFIVGGAAFNEWRKAAAASRAEVFGDAVLDALDLGGVEERRTALGAIKADGDQKAVLQLLLASDPDTDRAATLEALQALADDASQPQSYRDLAVLRRVMVLGAEASVSERRAALDPIAAAGRPFRTLALEQLAYLTLEEGKTDEAVAALQALMQDQEAPAGLRSRAEQMIVALGGEVAPSTAPQPAAPADAG